MSLTSRIQALTAYANEVTGESDTTLANAVASLAQGYGQGGGGYIQLLDTITVENDTRSVLIDMTRYPTLDICAIIVDIELTASDWLYIYRNATTVPTTPTGNFYSDKSRLIHKGTIAFIMTPMNTNTAQLFVIAKAGFQYVQEAVQSLLILTYESTKNIKAGSTVKIYGHYDLQ